MWLWYYVYTSHVATILCLYKPCGYDIMSIQAMWCVAECSLPMCWAGPTGGWTCCWGGPGRRLGCGPPFSTRDTTAPTSTTTWPCCGWSGSTELVRCVFPLLWELERVNRTGEMCFPTALRIGASQQNWWDVFSHCFENWSESTELVRCVFPLLWELERVNRTGEMCFPTALRIGASQQNWWDVFSHCCENWSESTELVRCVFPLLWELERVNRTGEMCFPTALRIGASQQNWWDVFSHCFENWSESTELVRCVFPLLWELERVNRTGEMCFPTALRIGASQQNWWDVFSHCCENWSESTELVRCVFPLHWELERVNRTGEMCFPTALRIGAGQQNWWDVFSHCCENWSESTELVRCVFPLLWELERVNRTGEMCFPTALRIGAGQQNWWDVFSHCSENWSESTELVRCVFPLHWELERVNRTGEMCFPTALRIGASQQNWWDVFSHCCENWSESTELVRCVFPLLWELERVNRTGEMRFPTALRIGASQQNWWYAFSHCFENWMELCRIRCISCILLHASMNDILYFHAVINFCYWCSNFETSSKILHTFFFELLIKVLSKWMIQQYIVSTT